MIVLKGHLTATDKKVVKSMLSQNLTVCGYRGTDYYISLENDVYSMKQVKMEWDCDFMRNKKVRTVYKSEFKA